MSNKGGKKERRGSTGDIDVKEKEREDGAE